MYVGHTKDERQQPLLDHLTGVAELCEAFAAPFGAQSLARFIGLCHDLGKYSAAGQKRLLANGPKVDHSTAGGLEALKLAGPLGGYCVFGHHGGLQDGGSKADTAGEPTFFGRQKRVPGKDIPDYSAFRSEVMLKQPESPPFQPLGETGFSCAMMLRMLFSCLVDADYLDTETFMQDGQVQRGGYQSIAELYAKLMAHIAPFSKSTKDINIKRSQILTQCIERAKGEKGLYSLTVPTGGGKTISSMAFALEHALAHDLKRIIYVIPYTSIIEQNAQVFADILGRENVLEHHSGFEYDNDEHDPEQKKLYLSTENWDAPIVVTTNVQFFESLFAAKTSRCRKLHNIAGSVIIFDEAQMLPIPYLQACVRSIAELTHNFGCTAVLCSATQPALDGLFPSQIQRTEICDDPKGLYTFFKRTTLCRLGTLTDEALAERLNGHEQVLCIVGTRKQAQQVFGLLEGEGNYHLSTLMYPECRKALIGEIKERLLKPGLPCRVVATSLIEAGVDVDFPTVYRAKAGLDSIIQAAGRCNREGKQSAKESIVYIFDPDEAYAPPMTQRQALEVFNAVAPKHEDGLDSLEAIHHFFEILYQVKGDGLDAKQIIPLLEAGWHNGGSFPFKTIGEAFRLIETNTYAILIPNTETGAEYARCLRAGERSRSLMRAMGRYCVNVYEYHYRALCELGIIEPLDEDIAILTDLSSYSLQTGLTMTPTGGKAIFAE